MEKFNTGKNIKEGLEQKGIRTPEMEGVQKTPSGELKLKPGATQAQKDAFENYQKRRQKGATSSEVTREEEDDFDTGTKFKKRLLP